MIDSATAAVPPAPARVSRVWRIVAIVVAVQAFLIVLGTFAFAALGFANDPSGGCGGG